MRYTIPAQKDDQKKEINRMFHAAASERELQNMTKALKWMVGCVNGTTPYDRKSYHKLYETYQLLGLTEGRKESALFPAANRSMEQFNEELDKLWRVLEVHAQEKNPSLLTSYQNYQRDPAAYDAGFRTFDQELRDQRLEEVMREPEGNLMEELPQNGKRSDTKVPLVNAKSPYAPLVKGSVYMEIYDLYKGLPKPQSGNAKSLPERLFLEDMQNLLSNMQLHYLRRNSMGNVLPMTEEEHQEMLELYQDSLRDWKKLPQKLQQTPEYKSLHTLLVQNEDQLRHLPVDELPALADVLSGSKDPTIHLISQEKETIGNAMSSREAVEYLDENGNRKRGFFTPERSLKEEKAEVNEILKNYERKYPQYSDYFEHIKNIQTQSGFSNMLDKVMDYHVFKTPDEGAPEPIRAYFQTKNWIRPEDKNKEAFWDRVFIPLLTEVSKSVNMQGVVRGSGFDTGDLLAERSTAMNDVAKALGCPDILVGSKRVTVKRGDQVETGVMMESADMELVDPSKLTKGHPFFNLDETQFDTKQMLSSLADLQIVDYLCANTDRHAHNFFYRVDFKDPDQPKLLGVQGIDNDNSFGAIKGGGQMKLASNENLKIITPRMADAVSNMTGEQLQNVLSPYHLSDAEIKAAKQRLKDLQGMIQKGRKNTKLEFTFGELGKPSLKNKKGSIHIVQDNEWGSLRTEALLPENSKDDGNIFRFSNSARKRVVKMNDYKRFHHQMKLELGRADTPEKREKALKSWHDWYPNIPIDAEGNIIKTEKRTKVEPINYTKQKSTVNYQKLATMQQKELASLEKMMQQLEDARGNKANRSDKFKAMRSALVDLTEEYRKMRRLDPEGNLINEEQKQRLEQNRDKNLADSYKRIEQKRQELKQAVDTYLGIRHWRFSPTENNQKRINTAKRLSGLVLETPASAKFYQSSKALQDAQKSKETSKDALAQNRYLTNRIHSMMKLALRDRVSSLALEDPLREKGLQAMKAQERLWNYSQSAVSDASVGVKKNPSLKEKTNLTELLHQANLKKKSEVWDADKICKDLNTIKEYAPELGESIDRITREKDKLTPKRVKGVLGSLFLREAEALKAQNQVQKNKSHVMGS